MGLGLTWNYVFANHVGDSHVRSGLPCQDEVAATCCVDTSGETVLGVFLSDGAGSAERGGIGAELAVQHALSYLGTDLVGLSVDRELGTSIITRIRGAILETAERHGHPARDYASTFLALICARSQGTLLIQQGDGGIVVDRGNGWECLTLPLNGEYANSTRFLTDGDANESTQIVMTDEPINRAALFSDGLSSLALNQADNSPHVPFFRPFFEALENSGHPVDDYDHPLQAALVSFLGSENVRARSDDDKSLAIAMWDDRSPDPTTARQAR
jgi:hypothetical protein